MGIIGGKLGYYTLRSLGRGPRVERNDQHHSLGGLDLEVWFGDGLTDAVRDRVVIDFGCGEGHMSAELALRGARKVIGVDVQEARLAIARRHAEEAGVAERCEFTTRVTEKADLILSKDAFEHFDNPGSVLGQMADMLLPGGHVLAAFGPTWLHPLGGHGFSIFPFSHLIFTEKAQIRWRRDFQDDGATCFAEVDGGLNKLTIRKFEKLVAASPFELDWLQTVPIRGLKLLKTRLLREVGSSIVRCQLRRRIDGAPHRNGAAQRAESRDVHSV